MQAVILQVSYLACAGAFLALSLMIGLRKQRSAYARPLLFASVVTFLWAISIVGQEWLADWIALIIGLEVARPLAWLFFLGSLLGIARNKSATLPRSFFLILVGAALLIILSAQLTPIAKTIGLAAQDRLLANDIGFITLSVIGLVLLENLYRNADEDSRWGIKFLCFGLGAIFAYDFFYYADTILFRGAKAELYQARGFVNALAAPLIAIAVTRTRSWNVDIHVSRQVVLHTAALVACGLYLLLMAGAGYYVKQFGGDWGSVFQITFFAGALLLLFVLFTSGSLKARVRLFIARNFYSAKYDYRTEWLRFINTLSSDKTEGTLQERIMHALVQVIDGRAAALWTLDPQAKQFSPTSIWNFGEEQPPEPFSSPLITRLSQSDEPPLVSTLLEDPALQSSPLLAWLKGKERAWFLLPLIHRDELVGILVMGRGRAEFELDWEDKELLAPLSRQAASYLAEEQAANALVEARQFEEFNKRFAFAAHDIKNVVNQLSLLVKNAERHGQNPEFQADMTDTVASSVSRMRQLLNQLTTQQAQKPSREEISGSFPLSPCLSKVAEAWQQSDAAFALDLAPQPITILGQESKLASALDHLLQNAVDAVDTIDGEGAVILHSRLDGRQVEVTVSDNGPGMSETFVREKLFQPLNSTKASGFGMGVFQVRQYIQDLGGELQVDTHLGQGTHMRIILPIHTEDQVEGAEKR